MVSIGHCCVLMSFVVMCRCAAYARTDRATCLHCGRHFKQVRALLLFFYSFGLTFIGSIIGTFPSINAAYGAVFSQRPPSRAAVGLSAGAPQALLLMAVRDSDSDTVAAQSKRIGQTASKSVLHVQSISHWAPACIGPYAQANTVCILNKCLYCA